MNMQQRASINIYQKKAQERFVKKSIMAGLHTMRKVLLFDSENLGVEYRFLIPVLNSLLTQHQAIVEKVARLYIQLPIYLHAINLVRWYGQFRNNGDYNKVMYFTTLRHMKNMMADQADLKTKGTELCPTLAVLTKAIAIVGRKEAALLEQKNDVPKLN